MSILIENCDEKKNSLISENGNNPGEECNNTDDVSGSERSLPRDSSIPDFNLIEKKTCINRRLWKLTGFSEYESLNFSENSDHDNASLVSYKWFIMSSLLFKVSNYQLNLFQGVGLACPRLREPRECEQREPGVRPAGQHGVGQRVHGQREHRGGDREPRQHPDLAADAGQGPCVGHFRRQLRGHVQEVLHGPGPEQR